jgi:hypothetical protein
LEYVVAHWPVAEIGKWPKTKAERDQLRAKFGDYLVPNFNIGNLHWDIYPQWAEISEGVTEGDTAHFLLWSRTRAFLAILKRNGGNWQLEAISFQCVQYFGTGINGTAVCDVCGGTGWGALGDLVLCVGKPGNAR